MTGLPCSSSRKAKPKSQPKPKAKAKAKVAMDRDDSDESDDDEPIWLAAARVAVKDIVANSDVNTLCIKQVRKQVQAVIPGVDLSDSNNKKLIKQVVLERMAKLT